MFWFSKLVRSREPQMDRHDFPCQLSKLDYVCWPPKPDKLALYFTRLRGTSWSWCSLAATLEVLCAGWCWGSRWCSCWRRPCCYRLSVDAAKRSKWHHVFWSPEQAPEPPQLTETEILVLPPTVLLFSVGVAHRCLELETTTLMRL